MDLKQSLEMVDLKPHIYIVLCLLACQLQNRSTLVAVKKLKPGLDRNDFLAEAETMKQLRHPKLLQLYAVCTRQEPILIVTQVLLEIKRSITR